MPRITHRPMSVRECLRFAYQVDIDQYLEVLRTEFGATPHPRENGALVIGELPLPFYRPTKTEDGITITGFNYVPLPSLLVAALDAHPELAPKLTMVDWTVEQDRIVHV